MGSGSGREGLGSGPERTRETRAPACGRGGAEAATSGAVLGAPLDRVLRPEPRRAEPDAVIGMADPSAHGARAVRDLLDRSGVGCRSPRRRTRPT
jgi:hypothetical protein